MRYRVQYLLYGGEDVVAKLEEAIPRGEGENHLVFVKDEAGWRYGRILFIESSGYSRTPLPLIECIDLSMEFGTGPIRPCWLKWKLDHSEVFGEVLEA